jgi:hypothetical protein
MKKIIMAAALALVLGTAGLTSAHAFNGGGTTYPHPIDPVPILTSQQVLALMKGCNPDSHYPLVPPVMTPAELAAAGFHTPQELDAWWQQFIKCFCRGHGNSNGHGG